MSDVFRARAEALHRCVQAFPPLPNQVGLLAMIHGRPVGLDLFSQSAANAKAHPKLVCSYALESLLDRNGKRHPNGASLTCARAFINEILEAEVTPFPSIGYGTDLRFEAPRLIGTALVHDDEVIHAAFFRL